MFYESNFNIQHAYVGPTVNNDDVFTVVIKKNRTKTSKCIAIANAFKPLSYFSSVVAMNAIRYTKSGIRVVNIWNKLYCLLILTIYLTAVVIIRQRVTWRETKTDLPLTIISKTFTALQCTEIIYDIFVISFGNSAEYIKIFKTIDDIDSHFNRSKTLFIKRRIFAISLIVIVVIVISCTWIIKNFNVISIITYFTFLIILLQGVNCVSYAIIIYVQFLNFFEVLMNKVGRMPLSNEIVFKDDITIFIIKKMFSDSCCPKLNNSYCWFQLMQIYDKICDCIHLFNNIYAKQILFMFNCWLLSTILAICRLISPSLKNNDMKNTDMYYYVFINLRPLFVAIFSELFIEGRRKTLSILTHCLVHRDLDPEYRNQIITMMALVETRHLELSAQVCPVTFKIMIDFAGRVTSYTILIIQHFYKTL